MSTSQYEKIAENVKDAPLFKGISKEEISHILNCLGAYTREYSRGQYIMLDNEEIKKVGLVMTGHIQMVRDEIDGGKTVLATINKNEVFGESFACGTSLSSTDLLLLSQRPSYCSCPFAGSFIPVEIIAVFIRKWWKIWKH